MKYPSSLTSLILKGRLPKKQFEMYFANQIMVINFFTKEKPKGGGGGGGPKGGFGKRPNLFQYFFWQPSLIIGLVGWSVGWLLGFSIACLWKPFINEMTSEFYSHQRHQNFIRNSKLMFFINTVYNIQVLLHWQPSFDNPGLYNCQILLTLPVSCLLQTWQISNLISRAGQLNHSTPHFLLPPH